VTYSDGDPAIKSLCQNSACRHDLIIWGLMKQVSPG
jgi:hypothetical protein